MENVGLDSHLQFLDFTGINEQERLYLTSALFSENEIVKLPWINLSKNTDNGKNESRQFQNGSLSSVQATVCTTESNYSVSKQVPTPNVDQTLKKYNNDVNKLSDATDPSHISLHNGSSGKATNNYPFVDQTVVINNNYRSSNFNDTKLDKSESVTVPFNSPNNQTSTQEIRNDSTSLPLTIKDVEKSWASLFNKSENGKPVIKEEQLESREFVQPSKKNAVLELNQNKVEIFIDPILHRLGEYFLNFSVNNQIISLQPRGLINKSNYCYINSILQALIACPPLYNLFSDLIKDVPSFDENRKNAPILRNMMKFFKEFNHLPADLRVNRRVDKNSRRREQRVIFDYDPPIEPSYIYKMLNGIRTDTFQVEGRQEDAEEFLGCVLNGLNDEMMELIKVINGKVSDSSQVKNNNVNIETNGSESEWQVMGPKNKGAVTRRTEIEKTPINNIFGGLLRSRIHRAGDQPTDNIQPFFTLPLNIEKATSVGEALELLVSKNQLEGVTSSLTNQEVEAWQQVSLEILPVVLILHLKCFDYKLDGCSKIIKALEFPIDLKIDSKLLSSKNNHSSKEKHYKLFAVVYHDGKEATKGHYITDGYHVGYASWLRYDDSSVKVVQEDQVLKPSGTKVPYLLFYRRSDFVKSK